MLFPFWATSEASQKVGTLIKLTSAGFDLQPHRTAAPLDPTIVLEVDFGSASFKHIYGVRPFSLIQDVLQLEAFQNSIVPSNKYPSWPRRPKRWSSEWNCDLVVPPSNDRSRLSPKPQVGKNLRSSPPCTGIKFGQYGNKNLTIDPLSNGERRVQVPSGS